MSKASLFIGPQTLGIIFLIVGLIQYRFPPKHINKWYGYRMPSAQKNQQTWDEANRYSAIYLIKSGIILIFTGLIIVGILYTFTLPARLEAGLTMFFFTISGIFPCVLMIVATEKHLEKKFAQKQE